MGMQGFAVGVADQRRAIVDFRGAAGGVVKILLFGDVGEPAAKGPPIGIVVQPQEVGRAVFEGVAVAGDSVELRGGGREIGKLDPQDDAPRHHAGPDLRLPLPAVRLDLLDGGSVRILGDGDDGLAGGLGRVDPQCCGAVPIGIDLGWMHGQAWRGGHLPVNHRTGTEKAENDGCSRRQREQSDARAGDQAP